MSCSQLDSRVEESRFTAKYSILVELGQEMNDPLEGKFCCINVVLT